MVNQCPFKNGHFAQSLRPAQIVFLEILVFLWLQSSRFWMDTNYALIVNTYQKRRKTFMDFQDSKAC